MADAPMITATIKGDVPTTTIRLTFDLVGIGQDSAFAQTVLGELTSAVHSLAPDTLDRFGISASTERNRTTAAAAAIQKLSAHAVTLSDQGLDFDALVAERRGGVAEQLRRSDLLKSVEVEPKLGEICHMAPGARLDAAVQWDRFDAFRGTKPDHIASVTVALGASLSLAISAGRPDDPDAVALTLRAQGGTAIGVPTVAVDQLRAAGLVL